MNFAFLGRISVKDYYIFSEGTLKRKDNTIYFVTEDNEKKALPIEQVDNLYIFNGINLNSSFLELLNSYEVKIHFYNYHGFYSGSFYPREKNKSGYIIVHQASHYSEKEKRLFLAKSFIKSAVHHILRNLRRHKTKDGIETIINLISTYSEKINDVKSVEQLMGIEGNVRQLYYQSFNIIINKKIFNFIKRSKMPPQDPINTLISFGNSIMYTSVLSEIYKTQLNPTISYLHEPSTKRFSLSLDIAEIFKPLIIDSIIFSIINNNMINKGHFSNIEGLCYLNDEGKKLFITEFDKKMSTTVKHRTLNRNVTYRYLIRLECYKLIKHIINDKVYKPLKAWW